MPLLTPLPADSLGHLSAAISTSLSTVLNDFGTSHGLAPLSWHTSVMTDVDLAGSYPGDAATPEAFEAVERWALAFGFANTTSMIGDDGLATWSGSVGKWRAELWCITDLDRFRDAYPDDDYFRSGSTH
ncbi:hypothetical protein [Planctomonas psychrotolerans]|uniref:hypothetical protein n=1 Tax=Planctomonas psychrotolerans TaxID=2528712 RepID=UPI001239BC71|nr:hypothetical protein [Planctomonas psychrotolerans]